jgi:hypothetical protein
LLDAGERAAAAVDQVLDVEDRAVEHLIDEELRARTLPDSQEGRKSGSFWDCERGAVRGEALLT